MRRFKGIIESPIPPQKDMIWLNQGIFKYCSGGKWIEVSNKVELDNVEGVEASVIAPVIKISNTTEDKQNNINVCSSLSTTEVISVDIEGTMYGIKYDVVGVYHNGTVSVLEGNHCTVFDIDFNTGEVTLDSKYDTSKFLPYVDLEIGNSEVTKAYNLERLQLGHFFVAMDYGYGVGTWDPTNGGQAHVVTAYGNTIYYSLGADGTVTKALESPDTYLDYINNGGTKSPSEFIVELVNLMG